MKNSITTVLILFGVIFTKFSAQTTPIDFNRKDCNGIQRHLFSDLDSGKAVIIEYFMINCAPCPAAGQKLEAMKTNLLSQFPGRVISYAIAFNNTYSQATVKNWVTSNGFSAIPMDSGATQVAYYGGMGMPTIVILAGKQTHSVLPSPYVGFNSSDTTVMAANIRNYLNSTNTNTTTTSIEQQVQVFSKLVVFPVPASDEITITFRNSSATEVSIAIYDIAGKLVKLLDKTKTTGNYSQSFATNEISSGNYIVKLQNGNQSIAYKITIEH